MAPGSQRAIRRILGILSIVFVRVSCWFPLPWVCIFFRTLGRVAPYVVPRLNRVGLENLERAFGDTLTCEEKRRILRGAMDNMMTVAAEFGRLPKMARTGFEGVIRVEGAEHADRDRGVLAISAHFGNWEWILPVAIAHGFKAAEVVRTFDDPTLNTFVDRVRKAGGVETIPKDSAAGRIRELLRDRYMVGLLVDQSPRENGVPTSFFGERCWSTIAPAMIAMRARVPVHPAALIRESDGTYTLRFYPAIEFEKTGNALDDLVENTQRCQDAIERMVRAHPEQWLWFHRRWKQRPRLEREWAARVARTRRRNAARQSNAAKGYEASSEP